MKVGFDIDGVLYPWHELIWLYCSQLPEYKLISESKFWENIVPQMSKEQMNEILELPFYDILPPFPFTAKLIKMLLSLDIEVCYISSRPPDTYLRTLNWLRKYDLLGIDLNYTGEFKKSDVIIQIDGLDFYFEDQLKHAKDIVEHTDTIVYLRHRIYNSAFYTYKNIIRYDDSVIEQVFSSMIEKNMEKKGIL